MIAAFEEAGVIVLERGWLSSNSILFGAANPDHETVLVDTGYWIHAPQTVALVRRLLGERPLHRIVNTHLHSDHCGGNHALQQAYGCALDVPSGEADKVDRWDEDKLTYRETGQGCPRFERTGVLQAGTEIELAGRRWQVLASPGHDPESMVLYEPELELLISADALWQNGFGIVFPEVEGGAHGFDAVRATLDRLAALRAANHLEVGGGGRGEIHKISAASVMFAADTMNKVLNEAVQIHGGYGYIWESEVNRLYRTIKLLEIGAGTTEVRKIIISDELLRG